MVVSDRRLIQRCEYTVPQHVCRAGCYWISSPSVGVEEQMTGGSS